MGGREKEEEEEGHTYVVVYRVCRKWQFDTGQGSL